MDWDPCTHKALVLVLGEIQQAIAIQHKGNLQELGKHRWCPWPRLPREEARKASERSNEKYSRLVVMGVSHVNVGNRVSKTGNSTCKGQEQQGPPCLWELTALPPRLLLLDGHISRAPSTHRSQRGHLLVSLSFVDALLDFLVAKRASRIPTCHPYFCNIDHPAWP